MSQTIRIEERLETALFAHPPRAGWAEAGDVTLAPSLTAADAATATLALLDSVSALSLLPSHVVVRDVAVVWRTASALTLTTHARPDEVESAVATVAGVSPAGRAVAAAVLQPFYGIVVRDWSDTAHPVDPEHVAITEGPSALIAEEDDEIYQEDLGRAWFLMTDRPFVSHVAVAPRQLVAGDPRRLADAVTRLLTLRQLALERARELRRDLAKAHGIDRDTLTETLADQTNVLDDLAVDGLAELVRRSRLSVTPAALRGSLVSVQQLAR